MPTSSGMSASEGGANYPAISRFALVGFFAHHASNSSMGIFSSISPATSPNGWRGSLNILPPWTERHAAEVGCSEGMQGGVLVLVPVLGLQRISRIRAGVGVHIDFVLVACRRGSFLVQHDVLVALIDLASDTLFQYFELIGNVLQHAFGIVYLV